MHLTITVSISLPGMALYLWWRHYRSKDRRRPCWSRGGSYLQYTALPRCMQLRRRGALVNPLDNAPGVPRHRSSGLIPTPPLFL